VAYPRKAAAAALSSHSNEVRIATLLSPKSSIGDKDPRQYPHVVDLTFRASIRNAPLSHEAFPEVADSLGIASRQ
jgi:hypothetical protein